MSSDRLDPFKFSTLHYPMTEYTKAHGDMIRRVLQQNLALLGNQFACLSEQCKRLSTIKKPEDFLNLQKEFINENINMMMENIQTISNTASSNMEELGKVYHSMQEHTQTTLRTAKREQENLKEQMK